MRHKVRTDRLGRFSSLRKATIKSIVTDVLLNQHIITTKAKAKSARRTVEKVINLGKKGTLFAKRRAFSILCDHNLVKLLFDKIAPKFLNRNGGYTRIIPYLRQRGDNAELVVLELTERYEVTKPKEISKEEKAQKQKLTQKQKKEEPPREEKIKDDVKVEPVEKKEEEVAKEKPIKKEIKEEKEPVKHKDEAVAHPEEAKQKQPEKKKLTKFLKGFKGFFKKERDQL